MEPEEIAVGSEVVDADGERLGSVIAAAPDYIVAEQGFFFPTDFYLPRSIITNVEDGIVQLSVSKNDILSQGWSVQPEANTPPAAVPTEKPQ